MKNKSIKLNAVLNVIKQCMGILFSQITYPYVSRALGTGNLGRYSFSDSIVQTHEMSEINEHCWFYRMRFFSGKGLLKEFVYE